MRINILSILCFVLLLFSCEGNCPDETLEKVEWVTINKKIERDTLVNYKILTYDTEYLGEDKLIFKLKLKNLNNTYKNKFFIRFYQKKVDYLNNINWEKFETDSVFIKPNESFTFEYTSNQASKFSNFNTSFYIIQKPVKYGYYVRLDSLTRTKETLNSCETNIEAFIKEQKSIEKLFYEKTNENIDILLKKNWDNGFKLNNLAWKIYENSDDAEKLNNAILYVERSIDINRNYYNLDTYSALLFKINNFKKANEIGREAIRIAKRDSIDYEVTTKLMKKFNAKDK